MRKIITLIFAVAFFAAPAYADAESAGKPLNYLEFSSAPENRSMPKRVVDWRYSEYRNGRIAVTTLDTAHLR